ncbi:hypothetical protein [Bacillus swezeyi]|uniref:hypothetical protein n=1 Tax=Bacillus swezeyi TaxID=1925020 RepID=UPI001680AC03|nr:hypothetical protein [Bacillus swezeyi]
MSYNYYQLVDKVKKSGFIDKLRQSGRLSLLFKNSGAAATRNLEAFSMPFSSMSDLGCYG